MHKEIYSNLTFENTNILAEVIYCVPQYTKYFEMLLIYQICSLVG